MVAIDPIRPLLLQRYPKERDAARLVAHDLQEVMDVESLLNVIRQVKMRIVEKVILRRRLKCEPRHKSVDHRRMFWPANNTCWLEGTHKTRF